MNQRDELFQEVFGGFLQDQDNLSGGYQRYLKHRFWKVKTCIMKWPKGPWVNWIWANNRRAATSSSRSERSLQASGATCRGRCETSLRARFRVSERWKRERHRGVALAKSLWRGVTATSWCRSGEVAPMHCSSNDHLYHLFWAPNAPKCLQELHVVLQYLIRTHVCKMQPKHG